MEHTERIKTAFERQTRAVTLRPGIGQGTVKTRVSTGDGLNCQIREGDLVLKSDMNEKWGGSATGPTPGTYGRAAFAACLAISYKMWAARLDLAIADLNIEIEADYDTRGACGFTEVSAAYTEFRYQISLKSDAAPKVIVDMLDLAESHSTYFIIFDRALELRRKVIINGTEVGNNGR